MRVRARVWQGGASNRAPMASPQANGRYTLPTSAKTRFYKPFHIITAGAGAGIGQAVAYKFAMEGYHACIARRGSGPNRLMGRGEESDPTKDLFQHFCDGIERDGGSASPFYFDGTDPEAVAEAITTIERDVGPIHVAVYNIGAQVGTRSLDATSYRCV